MTGDAAAYFWVVVRSAVLSQQLHQREWFKMGQVEVLNT